MCDDVHDGVCDVVYDVVCDVVCDSVSGGEGCAWVERFYADLGF